MITPERLAQIEAEANAATEGPWEAAENHIEVRGCLVAAVQFHGNVRTVMTTSEQYNHADATFIANARQNIPDLVAEVRRLQAENERLTTNLQAAEADLSSARERLNEAALTIAAERGRPEGAPSEGWTFLEDRWVKAYEDRSDAIVLRDGSWLRGRFHGKTPATQGKAASQRAGMIAADQVRISSLAAS